MYFRVVIPRCFIGFCCELQLAVGFYDLLFGGNFAKNPRIGLIHVSSGHITPLGDF